MYLEEDQKFDLTDEFSIIFNLLKKKSNSITKSCLLLSMLKLSAR